MIEWNDYFTYDETISSCLRGKPSTRNKNGIPRGSVSATCKYYRIHWKNKMYSAHRIIWEMLKGKIPEGFCVDHIDGDIHNNKISNLRCVTLKLNSRNKKLYVNSTSKEQGISLSTNNLGNQYYVFQWITLDGEKKRKRFSCTKLGKEKALESAIIFKKLISEELLNQGYSKRHHHGE